MIYRVDFFKEGGKWYTDEEIIIPPSLIRQADEFNSNKEWGRASYEIRKFVKDTLIHGLQHYKGMHAVVTVPEDDDYLVYPLMIPASERR